MTVCPISTVVASEGAGDITFTTILSTNTSEECRVNLGGGQGTIELVVFSMYGDLAVTLRAGDGPTAAGDRTIITRRGVGKSISIPTGECVRADGSIHFRVESGSAIKDLSPMIAVIRRLNTIAH